MIPTDRALDALAALASTSLLALVAGTGAVITGGIYAAFHVMVLPALDRLGTARATEVMRAINLAAERPAFLSLFFGTPVASVAAAGSLILNGEAGKGMTGSVLAGAGLAAAAFALTLVVNVPMNRKLATTDNPPHAWASYRRRWGTANSVRAVMSIAGGVALLSAP